jgi:hypothetical protein
MQLAGVQVSRQNRQPKAAAPAGIASPAVLFVMPPQAMNMGFIDIQQHKGCCYTWWVRALAFCLTQS